MYKLKPEKKEEKRGGSFATVSAWPFGVSWNMLNLLVVPMLILFQIKYFIVIVIVIVSLLGNSLTVSKLTCGGGIQYKRQEL